MRRTALLGLLALTGPARADTVDLAAWASGLPAAFAVHGTVSQPTWQESVDLVREGDRIAVTGGAPGWAQRTTEVVRVQADGTLCPGEAGCAPAPGPGGFLALAGLLAAARRHRLAGRAAVIPFGDREVVCLPGESVGIAQPVLDPCFDRDSGAAVAQRHRRSGAFDGPTLDPAALRVVILPGAAAPHLEDQDP